jgi:hypothetical protein
MSQHHVIDRERENIIPSNCGKSQLAMLYYKEINTNKTNHTGYLWQFQQAK